MNKGKLINVIGDVTTPQRIAPDEIVVITHCCNSIGQWGRGFVLSLSRKWEEPEQRYRDFCEKNKDISILGRTCFAKIDKNLVVANMIGQEGIVSESNPIPIKYKALIDAMTKVKEYIEMIKVQTTRPVVIHAPKFGSQLAGGNFDFILELIREIWLEAGIDVVVYDYVG